MYNDVTSNASMEYPSLIVAFGSTCWKVLVLGKWAGINLNSCTRTRFSTHEMLSVGSPKLLMIGLTLKQDASTVVQPFGGNL